MPVKRKNDKSASEEIVRGPYSLDESADFGWEIRKGGRVALVTYKPPRGENRVEVVQIVNALNAEANRAKTYRAALREAEAGLRFAGADEKLNAKKGFIPSKTLALRAVLKALGRKS